MCNIIVYRTILIVISGDVHAFWNIINVPERLLRNFYLITCHNYADILAIKFPEFLYHQEYSGCVRGEETNTYRWASTVSFVIVLSELGKECGEAAIQFCRDGLTAKLG